MLEKATVDAVSEPRKIRIGLWGPAQSGKTTYLLSLYIASKKKDTDWLIGFDDVDSYFRNGFLQSAVGFMNGQWPEISIDTEPILHSFIFYHNKKKKVNAPDHLLEGLWKFLTKESLNTDSFNVSFSDVSGERYLTAPSDSNLWEHLASCDALVCLIDPNNFNDQLKITSNIVEFLFDKIRKDTPERLIDGRYLPQFISVCFTKMDRQGWIETIDNPYEVLEHLDAKTGLSLRMQLLLHFLPNRLSFHCISSIGIGAFPLDNTPGSKQYSIAPHNIFAPLDSILEFVTSGKVSNNENEKATRIYRDPVRKRWAILVGVNDYIDPAFMSLKFCVNDVVDLQKILEKSGYTVISLHDKVSDKWKLPTYNNVDATLTHIIQSVEEDDLIWVHFACHGTLVRKKALLVLQDSRAPTLGKTTLAVSDIEKRLKKSKARRSILTLDACHTGVDIGRSLSDPAFINNVYELAEGFALIAASTSQQVAHEWGKKKHGVFTYYLLDGLSGNADRLQKGFVTVDDIKNHTLDGLRRWNLEHGGLVQEPTAKTEGLGDIILADFRKR